MVVRPTLQRAAARQGERGVRSMTAIHATVAAIASRMRMGEASATKPGAGLLKFFATRAGSPVSMAMPPSQISAATSVKVIMPNQSKALAAPRRRRDAPAAASSVSGTSAGRSVAGFGASATNSIVAQAVAASIRKFCACSALRRSSQSVHSASGSTGHAAQASISR